MDRIYKKTSVILTAVFFLMPFLASANTQSILSFSSVNSTTQTATAIASGVIQGTVGGYLLCYVRSSTGADLTSVESASHGSLQLLRRDITTVTAAVYWYGMTWGYSSPDNIIATRSGTGGNMQLRCVVLSGVNLANPVSTGGEDENLIPSSSYSFSFNPRRQDVAAYFVLSKVEATATTWSTGNGQTQCVIPSGGNCFMFASSPLKYSNTVDLATTQSVAVTVINSYIGINTMPDVYSTNNAYTSATTFGTDLGGFIGGIIVKVLVVFAGLIALGVAIWYVRRYILHRRLGVVNDWYDQNGTEQLQ